MSQINFWTVPSWWPSSTLIERPLHFPLGCPICYKKERFVGYTHKTCRQSTLATFQGGAEGRCDQSVWILECCDVTAANIITSSSSCSSSLMSSYRKRHTVDPCSFMVGSEHFSNRKNWRLSLVLFSVASNWRHRCGSLVCSLHFF